MILLNIKVILLFTKYINTEKKDLLGHTFKIHGLMCQ